MAVAPPRRPAGPGVVRRLGPLVGLDERTRRAEASRKHRQPGRGPSLPTGERDDVTRACARSGHRVTVHGAERGDRDDDLVGGCQVTSDHRGTHERALVGDPAGQPGGPGHRQVGGCGKTHRERGGAAAHGVDVGQVRRRDLVTDLLRRRPVTPEVAGVDVQVGRHHDAAVGHATTAASSPGPRSTWSPWANSAASVRTSPNSPTSASVSSLLSRRWPVMASCPGAVLRLSWRGMLIVHLRAAIKPQRPDRVPAGPPRTVG